MSNKEIIAAPETLPSAQAESAQLMNMIITLAKDPAADVGKMRALLDFKRELMKDAAKVEADQAFSRVLANMPRIKKNGHIDFGKGQKPIPYAKWEDIEEVIRPIYQAEGFRVSHDTAPAEISGWTRYVAIATHLNGHEIKAGIPLPLDTSGGKQNIQGAGSSSSYGVRYSTKLLFNLVFEGEDDDGKLAGTKFISLDQIKEVNTLLSDTKTDVTKFLQLFEVAEVANLTQDQFAPACNMLRAKIAQQRAKS
jgi:hypothetical protein